MFTNEDVRRAVAAESDEEHAYIYVTKSGKVQTAKISSINNPDRNQADVAGYLKSFAAGTNHFGPDAAIDDDFIRHCYFLLVYAYHQFLTTRKTCWVSDDPPDAFLEKPLQESVDRLRMEIIDLEKKRNV